MQQHLNGSVLTYSPRIPSPLSPATPLANPSFYRFVSLYASVVIVDTHIINVLNEIVLPLFVVYLSPCCWKGLIGVARCVLPRRRWRCEGLRFSIAQFFLIFIFLMRIFLACEKVSGILRAR